MVVIKWRSRLCVTYIICSEESLFNLEQWFLTAGVSLEDVNKFPEGEPRRALEHGKFDQ